ncbi:MAG: hypothetical protein ACK50I_12195 [Burkholderiales bacterium]
MAADTTPKAAVIAALIVAALAASTVAAASRAAEPSPDTPMIAKPGAAAKRIAPTHAWRDGAATRALTVDPGLRADFSGGVAGRSVVLRIATGPLKDVSPALQSPVLRDESGRARALPGGVVVTFADPTDEPAARALLAAHGAPAARPLSPRAWLVESPPGLASLELANRLATTGAFAGAQPNWWVERALK